MLVFASGDATQAHERCAALQLFEREAGDIGYLYSAEDAASVALAERIGDRLWLTPRRQLGLGAAEAWRELMRSHRYELVVAVVPSSALELGLHAFRRSEGGAHCTRLAAAPSPVLELSLPAEAV